MNRITVISLLLGMLCGIGRQASAGPIQIDFNVAGYGPTIGTHQTFVTSGPGLPMLTFESLDDTLSAAGYLYWDAGDGNGYADGFAVRAFPNGSDLSTGYPAPGQTFAEDEIEGGERLRLTFSSAVAPLSFNLTDLFYETEDLFGPNAPCPEAPTHCYRESGSYSIDGGLAWTPFMAALDQLRVQTNGELTVPVNQLTTSLILRSPGALSVPGFPYTQLLKFSLSGVGIDPAPVPEPASMLLLGAGIVRLAISRRRRHQPVS